MCYHEVALNRPVWFVAATAQDGLIQVFLRTRSIFDAFVTVPSNTGTEAMNNPKDSEFGIADWQRLLRSIGEDPSRQGLHETPGRVSRAWAHWTRGYKQDPAAILKTFADGGESYDELIVVRQIPVYSHCEHHLAPFFGHATVGYLPSGHIVGLSKLTRLVNCFAARLQVQERLTQQIAQSLLNNVVLRAVVLRAWVFS